MARRAPTAAATRNVGTVVEQRVQRFRRYKSWFWQEMSRQAANRFQMALDEDYYDSLQIAVDDAQEMLRRGQAPVVWNEVKPTIDWLLGTERRVRTDFKVRSEEHTSELQSLMRNSYAVLCLKKKNKPKDI